MMMRLKVFLLALSIGFVLLIGCINTSYNDSKKANCRRQELARKETLDRVENLNGISVKRDENVLYRKDNTKIEGLDGLKLE